MARFLTRVRQFFERARGLIVLEPPGYWSDKETGKPVPEGEWPGKGRSRDDQP